MTNSPGYIGSGDVPQWDRSADVVVVGMGIAGACAALEACAAGATVLVIERSVEHFDWLETQGIPFERS